MTEYKKDGVEDENNSKVVEKEIAGETFATTDTLELTGQALNNINAGFTENSKFDLSLKKEVSKITVKNGQGTRELTYKGEEVAKVEVHSKQIENTTITVEYLIKVTNEGEIQGYVGDIVDYKPQDLEFNKENNKDWQIGKDGNLHNVSLANSVIKKGETKEVKLILTKKLSEDNMGTSINTAEIASANNEYKISDIDSTPGNKAKNEDDMGTARILVSVSTGLIVTISISTIVLIILAIAGYLIYKKRKGGVLSEDKSKTKT